ncbi:probable helicase with zinc finger domain isoform X2 [Ornithodoros turicata]|uniref:probable helicase with zinc finger domain isoform X2 n=1 Tax=Ornithodoros turicata TaxID=34597 RepID=UPI0031386C49
MLALNLASEVTSKARAKVILAYLQIGHTAVAERILHSWLHNSPQDPHALRTLKDVRSTVDTDTVVMELPQKEVAPSTAGEPVPLLHCDICKETFQDEEQLRAHCSSREHRDALASDDGRDWKFRPPPRGILVPVVCESHETPGGCHQGKQCCLAHGSDELAEWKERLRYRKSRLQRALEQQLVGGYLQYAEELLQDFREAPDPTTVLTEELRGLLIKCVQPLDVTIHSKEAQQDWNFMLKTKTALHRLVLLEDSFRHNFCLKQVKVQRIGYNFEGDDRQEWVNTSRCSSDNEKTITYQIKVAFRASMYATFKQTLALDFGGRPVLVRHLSVDVVSKDVCRELERRKRAVVSGTRQWAKADVVFSTDPEPGQSLLDQYPAPDPRTFKLTQGLVLEKLTKNNYVARMHELLHVEELTRADIVARHNICTTLDVRNTIETSARDATQTSYAQGGELYAVLGLEEDITDDTPAGELLLTGCKRVWFSLVSQKDGKVYEALLEHVSKKVVYLRLQRDCVQELGLTPRTKLDVEIQFHLNRLPLCEMHYAVDKLCPTSLVFPDFSVEPDLPAEDETYKLLDSRLNVHQRRAIACITAPRNKPNIPPVLIVGPFGTGKTFTLANAVLRVLQQDDEARVLVCTHSNSAADLYILEYLDKYVKDHPQARPLRIIYEYRKPNRVDPRLLPYCLQTNASAYEGPWFRQPTTEEMEGYRVVITTLSSSRMLLNSGVRKGFFTHILIDEAAQVMESECILPIALADDSTRLVFAGDYMQINPHVYSVVARECGLQVSLLERLNQLYPRTHCCRVLLQDNYRSHEILVRYTSESFYDSRLRSAGYRVSHSYFPPLTFFAARGSDLVDDTSFFNNAEVREVCDQMYKVVEGWPKEWGPLDLSKIAVVTPYYEQVSRIRAELRRIGFSKVKVESVANVQGKEFRVVMLTTVRTRATCQQHQDASPVDLNFGFLSDSKLLNTAITRAQSLVVVVGDPITLCSIGACRKHWEKLIRACRQLGSLYNMTWEDIAYQLNGIELKREYGLNPRAESFVPPSYESPVDRHLAQYAMQYVQNSMLQQTATNWSRSAGQANPWWWHWWHWQQQQVSYHAAQQAAQQGAPLATRQNAHHVSNQTAHHVQEDVRHTGVMKQPFARVSPPVCGGTGHNKPKMSGQRSTLNAGDYTGYVLQQCNSSSNNGHQVQESLHLREQNDVKVVDLKSKQLADRPALHASRGDSDPDTSGTPQAMSQNNDYMSRIMSQRNGAVPRRDMPRQKNLVQSNPTTKASFSHGNSMPQEPRTSSTLQAVSRDSTFMSRMMPPRNGAVPRRDFPKQTNPLKSNPTTNATHRAPVHQHPSLNTSASAPSQKITPTVAYISNAHKPVEWHAEDVTSAWRETNGVQQRDLSWEEPQQKVFNQIKQQMMINKQPAVGTTRQQQSYADVAKMGFKRS